MYCKSTQIRSSALQHETSEYSSAVDDGTYITLFLNRSCVTSFPTLYAEKSGIMAIRCLALLFSPLKTKKLGESIPFIMKVVTVSI